MVKHNILTYVIIISTLDTLIRIIHYLLDFKINLVFTAILLTQYNVNILIINILILFTFCNF